SVAFFGAVAYVARALDLVAIAALIKYFLEYIFIILIVVFHQEIRRVLLRTGHQLLPQSRQIAARSAVGELLQAMERLRRAKIGALFILQGEFDVLDVSSDRGREIDATLHADTLVALMIPHPINHAHDGAVLVQNFRIARAGVILPLTRRDHLDPRFGTRHRGALGISEETDALVLVVSEERGEIRVVHRGNISGALNSSELEQRIQTWLEQPRAEASVSTSSGKAAAESIVSTRRHEGSSPDEPMVAAAESQATGMVTESVKGAG
ncbi:MAG: diadenylate cyclase, partial [Nannocystaceae bacterium]